MCIYIYIYIYAYIILYYNVDIQHYMKDNGACKDSVVLYFNVEIHSL